MKKTLIALSLVTAFAQAADKPVTYICTTQRPATEVELRAMPGAGTRCGSNTFVQAEGRIEGKGFRFGTCTIHHGEARPRGSHVFNALPEEEKGNAYVDTLAIEDIELEKNYSFQGAYLTVVLNGQTLPAQALVCRFE